MKKNIPSQKFIIESDGNIKIDWISTEFSDVIIELLPEKERNQIKEMNKNMPLGPKIFCG